MDVLAAIWHAHGEPCPPELDFDVVGTCARCGERGVTASARTVVSDNWTAWDSWKTAQQPRLCICCSWGYREPSLRSGQFKITKSREMSWLAPSQLYAELCEPIGSDVCVVLPLHLNRKHLAPAALWSCVCVDDLALTWNAGDVARLTAMATLRQFGFGSQMLTGPVPPYRVLTAAGRAHTAEIMRLWACLEPWRVRRAWFDAGIRATMHFSRQRRGSHEGADRGEPR